MKNLIIISLDCVRQEAMSCYDVSFRTMLHETVSVINVRGAGVAQKFMRPFVDPLLKACTRPFTPNIDGIASQGMIFTSAFTQAPFTPAAHASLFTGLNPPRHGIRKMCGLKLKDGVVTFAEFLKGNGYKTIGVIGSNALGKEFGLDRGFDIYDFSPERLTSRFGQQQIYRRDCRQVTGKALEYLSTIGNDKFFMFIHYFDAHEENSNISYQPLWQVIQIKKIDSQIGRLLRYLEKKQLISDTAILILADHGNSFGEHGEETHREYLYDSTIRIPMILKLDGAWRKGKISAVVRIIDMFPTLCAALGQSLPVCLGLDGRDILSLITRNAEVKTQAYAETYLEEYTEELEHIKSRRASIRTSEWKLIVETLSKKKELYNIRNDPNESCNVYEQFPEVGGTLLNDVFAVLGKDEVFEKNKMTSKEVSELKKSLRSLGYL